MKTSPHKRPLALCASLLGAAGLFAQTPTFSEEGSTIFLDTFAVGDRTILGTPDATGFIDSGAWFSSATGTDLRVDGGALTQFNSGRHVLGYFRPVDDPVVLDAGDRLVARFHFRFDHNTALGSGDFRFGLFDSKGVRAMLEPTRGTSTGNAGPEFTDWNGFIFTLNAGTQGGPIRFWERTDNQPILIATTGIYTQRGESGEAPYALEPNTDYEGTFIIERTDADTVVLHARLAEDYAHTVSIEHAGSLSFDTIVFHTTTGLGQTALRLASVEIATTVDLSRDPDPDPDPDATWRSVYYPADWIPPQFRTGLDFIEDRFIQDFSFAGYHRGEKPVPLVNGPVFNVLDHGADPTGATDSTDAIQATINAAQTAGGGVVFLPEGEYRVSRPQNRNHALRISRSNIVLRGAGPDRTHIINTTTAMRSASVILVFPETANSWAVTGSPPTAIIEDYPGPTQSVRVASTRLLNPGEWIVLHNPFTDQIAGQGSFVQDLLLDGTRPGPSWIGEGAALGGPKFLRQIVEIEQESGTSGTITFDAPTRWRLLRRDGARLYRAASLLEEIGLEGFSVGNLRHPGTIQLAENDYTVVGNPAHDMHSSYLINIQHVNNGWVRSVHSRDPGNNNGVHMLSNGVVLNWVRGFTLQHVRMERAQYGGGGGNGYMVRLNAANEVLVRDSHVGYCRHGFVMWRMQNSGNVFHNCTDVFTGVQIGNTGALQFTSGRGSDHHGLFSHSNLADLHQVEQSFIEAAFRGTSGTLNHAQSSSQTVFWNTHGTSYFPGRNYIAHSEQFGHGYIIGTQGTATAVNTGPGRAGSTVFTLPVDWTEGIGEGADLEPQSLFLDQVRQRFRREGLPPPPWQGATLLRDDFLSLPGLGIFYQPEEQPYIYLPDFGWLHVRGDDPNSFFLYHPGLGWLWSSRPILPFVWNYGDSDWNALLPGDN